MSAAQNVNLMQAARRIAQMPIGLAAELLKVQVDEPGVFGIGREVNALRVVHSDTSALQRAGPLRADGQGVLYSRAGQHCRSWHGPAQESVGL